MSIQKHIIEVTPPKYEQVHERMEFRNYRCPVCNGEGASIEPDGHNHTKRIPCNYCDGTGKVRAEVTIKWRADYGE